MPFTFSHPAIILPLTKLSSKYISASALIIGSMSPDFEYFIRMKLMQVHGHTLAGAFYFDLPLTLACVFIFQLLIKDVLIEHLPSFLFKKYKKHYQQNWLAYFKSKWLVVILSAIIGIFSHLFWDAFTHAPGYFVQFIPWLQSDLLIFNVPIPAYDFMQLISTLVGGSIIFLVILWPIKSTKDDRSYQSSLKYCLIIIAVTFLVMTLRGIQNLGDFIATSIAGVGIGIIIASLIFRKSQLTNSVKQGDSNLV